MITFSKNIDEAIEQTWDDMQTPGTELLDAFTAYCNQNAGKFNKEQKLHARITEFRLLRTLNRHAEADSYLAKGKNALNQVKDTLFSHRWRRMQVVEKFRLGNTTDTHIAAKELADEAKAQNWPREQLAALFLQHLINMHAGFFQQAIEFAQKGKMLAVECKDEFYIRENTVGVAHAYHLFDQNEEALAACIKAKPLYTHDYSKPYHLSFYILLAACYQSLKNFEEAKNIYESIIQYLDRHKINNPAVYIAAVSNLALAYGELGNTLANEKMLLHVESYAKKLNWPRFQFTSAVSLARLYHDAQKYDKMKSALQRVEQAAIKENALSSQVKILELKAMYAKATGQASVALELHEQFHRKFEERLTLDNNEKLRAQELKHELQLQTLNHENMKKDLRQREQEMQILNSHMGQKDKLINQFADYFTELEETNIRRKEIFVKLREMVHTVKHAPQTDIESYSSKFNEAHKVSIAKLTKKFPEISKAEAETAVMLANGLSNKEISSLTLTTIRNIEKHRLSLRKKMELKHGEDLLQNLREMI